MRTDPTTTPADPPPARPGPPSGPDGLVGALRTFDRKERSLLVREALGLPGYEPHPRFRTRLAAACGIPAVPAGAFVATDFHLDWLAAALAWSSGRTAPGVLNERRGTEVTGSQEDIDLLVAFQADDGRDHVILCEAKGFTSWTNAQLRRKAERLRAILGGDARRFPGVEPYFVLVGPREPSKADVGSWPAWMHAEGRLRFLSLPDPGERFKVTRCDLAGQSRADGWTHWRIVPARWPGGTDSGPAADGEGARG